MASATPTDARVSAPEVVRVPMRDGITLAADVYRPTGSGRFPVLLMRTPYPRRNLWRIATMAEFYTSRGYVLVTQDVRGRGESDGNFGFWFQEVDDGFDTVEWVAAQPWSNGRVGMLGSSYLGSTQWMAARARPPHLSCIAPTAATTDPFAAFPYVGGALRTYSALGWAFDAARRRGDPPPPNVDQLALSRHRPLLTAPDSFLKRELPLFRDWLTHMTLDTYWRRYAFSDEDVARLTIPTLLVTGWWDSEGRGMLTMWRRLAPPGRPAQSRYLTIGPWTHAGTFFGDTATVGAFQPPANAVLDMREVHLAFFERCLKRDSAATQLPPVRLYITGANEWRTYESYPPPTVRERHLYLRSDGGANAPATDGRLSWERPGRESPDRYAYDPTRDPPPLPERLSTRDDVRARDDVLVYLGEPLREALEVVGDVRIELHAASDGRDTDWVVHLFEVLPDGRAFRIGTNPGLLRARFRDGFDRERLLEPNRPTLFRIHLAEVGHRIQAGNRLRIEISSSAAPNFDRNLNTGNPIATDVVGRVARQTIYHDRARPSRVVLPVLQP